MAHLRTGFWVFAPTSRDGDRDIEMSRHLRMDFVCRHISFGGINVHPLAGEARFPRRHQDENRQRTIFSPLTFASFTLRPQTPTNIHWDYLCNRHVKCFGLYQMQQVKSDAVNRINSKCRNIILAAEAAPFSVARSMPPPPDVCPSMCDIR